jgi:hypothetical protein
LLVIARVVFVETIPNELNINRHKIPAPPSPIIYIKKTLQWLINTRTIITEIIEECIINAANELDKYGGI